MYNEGILSLSQYNTTTGVIIIESEGIAHRDSVIIKGNIALENSNIYYIRNITIDQEDAYSYGYGVLASQGRIDLYNVVIDASDTVVENGTLYCIRAEGGTIRIWSSDIENQNGVIVKIPATLQGCIMANQGGLISFTADITIQNNGNFVIACAYALQSGTIERSSSSLPYPDRSALIIASDTVTGPRYNALLNGIINSRNGGAEYFPGSEDGSTSKGGQYN